MDNMKVPLYCSEQIRIPDMLPDIIKTYCKAAIKTQPHDLLKWSAAYFRSLADDQLPVMRTCLEKEIRNKYLTKGCLRMFIEHIGKGFFVQKRILQTVWEMVLPLDEFYKLLSLARMLHWKELHWLKLIGIMAGMLSNDLKSTMILICELLTNDLEGGTASIPIWMFLTIYKYLAEIDCSKEQRILNGCKEMEDGSFEELLEPNELPYIISSISLNKFLTELCYKNKTNEDNCDDDSDNKMCESDSSESSVKKVNNKDESKKLWDRDYKMLDDFENPEDFFKKCQDFDALMFYIKTHQIDKSHELREGPHHVSSTTIHNATENEREISQLREEHDILLRENLVYNEIYQHKIQMLKETNPIWCWLHDFAVFTNNMPNKSYNFISDDSIISDKTPDSRSDQTFMIFKNKSKTQSLNSQENNLTNSESLSSYNSSTDLKNISEILATQRKNNIHSTKSFNFPKNCDHISNSNEDFKEDSMENKFECKSPPEFELIVNNFEAVLQKTDTDSDTTFSQNYSSNVGNPNLSKVLKAAGEKTNINVEYQFIFDILKVALQQDVKFTNIDDILDYIRQEYSKWYTSKHCHDNVNDNECKSSDDETCLDLEWVNKETISEISNELSLTAYNYGAGDYQGSHAEHHQCNEETHLNGQEEIISTPLSTVTSSKKIITITPQLISQKLPNKNIEKIFDEDIPVNYKVRAQKVEKNMILGLISDTEISNPLHKEEELVSSDLSEPPVCVDKTGYHSDDSSIFPLPESESDSKIKFKEFKQTCQLKPPQKLQELTYDYIIPQLPGIGGKVSKKIMLKFIEFIKFCAYKQQGMIMKSNLLERKCPPLEDLHPFVCIEREIQQPTSTLITDKEDHKILLECIENNY